MENYQKIFKLSSLLLQYPEKDLLDNKRELNLAIKSIEGEKEQDYFRKFRDYLEQCNYDEVCENYVQTFDFDKKNSLYITYQQYGDQNERGDSLLKLKKQYAKAGLILETNELPDYLPLMLEFAAIAPLEYVEELLLQQKVNIDKLTEALTKSTSPYSNLLKACQNALEWIESQQLTRAREGVL